MLISPNHIIIIILQYCHINIYIWIWYLFTVEVMEVVIGQYLQWVSALISQKWNFDIKHALTLKEVKACKLKSIAKYNLMYMAVNSIILQININILLSIYSVEEVSCVAKWKEGSTFYFLGLLNNSHVQPDDYERRFRCFAYSKIFQGYHVAQSGDAECNLPNAMEGDRTMVLKQG